MKHAYRRLKGWIWQCAVDYAYGGNERFKNRVCYEIVITLPGMFWGFIE